MMVPSSHLCKAGQKTVFVPVQRSARRPFSAQVNQRESSVLMRDTPGKITPSKVHLGRERLERRARKQEALMRQLRGRGSLAGEEGEKGDSRTPATICRHSRRGGTPNALFYDFFAFSCPHGWRLAGTWALSAGAPRAEAVTYPCQEGRRVWMSPKSKRKVKE